MPKYLLLSNKASGVHPPGTSFAFKLTDKHGNPDNVPSTGLQWSVTFNGLPLNATQLSALCIAQVSHTWNRSSFGFQLRDDVTGVFDVVAEGHGLSKSWRLEIVELPEALTPEERLEATLTRMESLVERMEAAVAAAQALVK